MEIASEESTFDVCIVCRASVRHGFGHLMRSAALASTLCGSLKKAFVLFGDEAAIARSRTLSIGNSLLSFRSLDAGEHGAPIRCKVAIYDTTGGIRDPRCVESAAYRIALSPIEFGSDDVWLIDELILRAQPPEHVAKSARVTAGPELAVLGGDVVRHEPRRADIENYYLRRPQPPVCIALSAATAHKEVARFWALFAARLNKGGIKSQFLIPHGAINETCPNVSFYKFDEFPEAALASRLSITRTGLTAYELAYLNVPGVYWLSHARDSWLVDDLIAKGHGSVLLGAAEKLIDTIFDEQALEEVPARVDMEHGVVDGRGAVRIAELVEERVASIS